MHCLMQGRHGINTHRDAVRRPPTCASGHKTDGPQKSDTVAMDVGSRHAEGVLVVKCTPGLGTDCELPVHIHIVMHGLSHGQRWKGPHIKAHPEGKYVEFQLDPCQQNRSFAIRKRALIQNIFFLRAVLEVQTLFTTNH